MANLKLNIEKSIRIDKETNKKKGVILQYFPVVLKDAIDNWGIGVRAKRGNEFLNYYHELSILTGRAQSTLRSYVKEDNPEYPPIHILYAICMAIKDFTPIKFVGKLGEE